MKAPAQLKLIKAFFYLGLALFVTGITLILYTDKIHPVAIGMMVLGAMWSVMGFGWLMRTKEKQ